MRPIYDKAEKGKFDPYNIGMGLVGVFAAISVRCDKAINWIYDSLSVKTAYSAADAIKRLHDGSYKTYLIWSVAAAAIIIICYLR